MASVARYCCCGGCQKCDPTGSGNTPSVMQVNGVTAGTLNPARCTSIPDMSWSSYAVTDDYCLAQWFIINAVEYTGRVKIVKQTHTETTDCGDSKTFDSGKTYVQFLIDDPFAPPDDAYWEWEETTGFACDATTGKISGTHAFANAPCDIPGDLGCEGSPTLTVDP